LAVRAGNRLSGRSTGRAAQVDSQMASLSLRQEVRRILTPTQLEEWEDMRGNDDIRLVISGFSTSWSNVS